MKKLLIIPLGLLLVFAVGCYKTKDKMTRSVNEVVLSFPAVNQFNIAASGINYWNKALINPDLSKNKDTILFSLNIPHALDNSIKVNIGVDEAAVAAYNKDTLFGSTQYALMPPSYYTIAAPTIVMEKGVTDTTAMLVLNTSLFDISSTGYLLPLTITSADGISVSPMRTAYIHIEKAAAPSRSRASRAVVAFSSKEAVGEEDNNGKNERVFNLYDNAPATF